MFNSNGKHLENILLHFGIQSSIALDDNVRHLVNDSRAVKPHDIFCAVQGTAQNGSVYIEQAIANGCDLILMECPLASQHGEISAISADNSRIVQIHFYQLNQQLFNLAKAFYHCPQATLAMIGITGTNGKTSTSQMIAKLLNACQKQCAVIGTNGAGDVENLIPIANTTPGATQLHQLLNDFKENKHQVVAMEVSSHALEQRRVKASLFDIAVFTNLSRDHLDYHLTMANYAAAKQQIFTQNANQIAVINGDDKQGQTWLAKWPDTSTFVVYGRTAQISQYKRFVQALDIQHHQTGTTFTLKTECDEVAISSPLLGGFNVDNLLAAIAVLLVQKISLADITPAIKALSPVIGRMEVFLAKEKATAIVDYAHTPDALENALIACRQHCPGDLWLVFGCGGDRDQGKRAPMGEIAERLSDHIIVTNDNPRSEKPEAIAADILAGCQRPTNVTVMLERQQAVLMALKKAQSQDVVLLAGKGHEDYILIDNERITYSERELVRSIYTDEFNTAFEARS